VTFGHCEVPRLSRYILVLLSWLISVLTYTGFFVCVVVEFFKYEPRPDKGRARPLSENRLDHHHPPLRLPSAYQKRSGFDFWQFKTAEIIGNNKNHQKLYSVGRRFLGACKRYPSPLPVGPSCSPRFHQGYGEFGGLKMFFKKIQVRFLYVCMRRRNGLSEHT